MMNVNVTFGKQAVGYVVPVYELTPEWRTRKLVELRIKACIEDAEYEARQANPPQQPKG